MKIGREQKGGMNGQFAGGSQVEFSLWSVFQLGNVNKGFRLEALGTTEETN